MFRGKRVLITGASSGIGAALARRFAREGASLFLLARRRERLESLAAEVRSLGAPDPIITLVVDLAEPGAADRTAAQVRALGGGIDVLINNAGVGEYGLFSDQKIADLDRMMQLNMYGLVRLTHVVLPEMLNRRQGWILNVASMAAFQPVPYMGVYAATKSFVFNFSMALRHEVKSRGVVVSCLCPAGVRTEFFDRGGFDERREEFHRVSVDPAQIADAGYRALRQKRAYLVPGAVNRFAILIQRFFPIELVADVTARVLGPRKKKPQSGPLETKSKAPEVPNRSPQ